MARVGSRLRASSLTPAYSPATITAKVRCRRYAYTQHVHREIRIAAVQRPITTSIGKLDAPDALWPLATRRISMRARVQIRAPWRRPGCCPEHGWLIRFALRFSLSGQTPEQLTACVDEVVDVLQGLRNRIDHG